MIEQLVAALPEVYQPIFSHPELSTKVSRICVDRLELIKQSYDSLSKCLDRPLKVLDLGCAQGYISLSLAEKGAIVHGIDYLDKNIEVCEYLQRSNPHLNVKFETGLIEDFIKKIEPGSYDIVLGLSVFHHLVHKYGSDAIRGLIGYLIDNVGAIIFELALKNEPLYWASSLPDEAKYILGDVSYIHKLGAFETHLSEFKRPLYVASKKYVITSDFAEAFSSFTSEPHALSNGTHENSRYYYFSDRYIVKQYSFSHPTRGEHNRHEFLNEKNYYSSIPSGFNSIRLKLISESDEDAVVITERLSGMLLLDMINEKKAYDPDKIISDMLIQLSVLESVGLYHNDVRAWNIIIDDSSLYIIDYGSISKEKKDVVWPYNIFLSFFILLNEIIVGHVDNPDPMREIAISPINLPLKYKLWGNVIWEKPVSEWTFKFFHDSFVEFKNTDTDTDNSSNNIWMKAIETAINEQTIILKQLKHKSKELEFDNKQRDEISVSALKEQLSSSNLKSNQLEAKLVIAEAKACQNMQSFIDIANKNTYLEFALDHAKSEYVNERSRASAARDMLAAVRCELSNLKDSYNIAVAELENYESKTNSQVAQINNLNDERMKSSEYLTITCKQLHALEEEFKNKNNELKTLEEELDNNKNELKDTYTKLDKLSSENDQHWSLVQSLTQHIHYLEQNISSQKQVIQSRDQQLDSLIKQNEAIIESTSWKISAPIRCIKRLIFFHIPLMKFIKPKVKLLLQHLALYISRRKVLRSTVLWVLNKLPNIKKRLFRVAINPAWRSQIVEVQHKNTNIENRYALVVDEYTLSIFLRLKEKLNQER